MNGSVVPTLINTEVHMNFLNLKLGLYLFVKSRNIVLNINHHSFGNALLHPYGFS